MEWFTAAITWIKHECMFISWRDIAEILFFSGSVYSFLHWLNQDKQKSLVFWIYGYAALTFGSHFAQLNSMNLMLCFCSPVVLMLFMLMHQHMLQKNFVSLKNISPKLDKQYHWLEELMQACLHAINNNREVVCIIERTNSLELFVSAPSTFNATISKEIIELLISTVPNHEPLSLWVNHAGSLVTINPIWHVHPDETWVSPAIKALHKRKQDGLFISQKSDAIIFMLSPTTRLFDVLVEGKTVNQISAGHAFELLKKYSNLHESKTPRTHQTQPKHSREQNV
jgi:DNA integrity scanning protein DisA with diadenylate cyclase activity